MNYSTDNWLTRRLAHYGQGGTATTPQTQQQLAQQQLAAQLAAQEALEQVVQRRYIILVSHEGPVEYSLWKINPWGTRACVAMHMTLEEARELRRVKLVEERLAGEPEPELRWTEQPSQPPYPQQPGGVGLY